MSKGIFQSPKKAALFAGGTMLAVAILVGSEDREGALVQAAASVENGSGATASNSQFQQPQQQVAQSVQYAEEAQAVGWAEDDDLVDDTSGFDPTPEPFDPSEGDMYIVEDEY